MILFNLEKQVKDQNGINTIECQWHGIIFMHLLCWYYFSTMLLSVETFFVVKFSLANSRSGKSSNENYRWRVYLCFLFVASFSISIFLGSVVGYGKNGLGCSMKGSGPKWTISMGKAWLFHMFPALSLVVMLSMVVAVYKLLSSSLRNDVRIVRSVAWKMFMLPIFAYFVWALVLSARYKMIKFPVTLLSDFSSFRGFLISSYIWVLNAPVRQYMIKHCLFSCCLKIKVLQTYDENDVDVDMDEIKIYTELKGDRYITTTKTDHLDSSQWYR